MPECHCLQERTTRSIACPLWQILLLVNFFYEINRWLVRKDNFLAWTALVVGSAVTYGLGLAVVALCYRLYAPR